MRGCCGRCGVWIDQIWKDSSVCLLPWLGLVSTDDEQAVTKAIAGEHYGTGSIRRTRFCCWILQMSTCRFHKHGKDEALGRSTVGTGVQAGKSAQTLRHTVCCTHTYIVQHSTRHQLLQNFKHCFLRRVIEHDMASTSTSGGRSQAKVLLQTFALRMAVATAYGQLGTLQGTSDKASLALPRMATLLLSPGLVLWLFLGQICEAILLLVAARVRLKDV